jgi:hypothetical protein
LGLFSVSGQNGYFYVYFVLQNDLFFN